MGRDKVKRIPAFAGLLLLGWVAYTSPTNIYTCISLSQLYLRCGFFLLSFLKILKRRVKILKIKVYKNIVWMILVNRTDSIENDYFGSHFALFDPIFSVYIYWTFSILQKTVYITCNQTCFQHKTIYPTIF